MKPGHHALRRCSDIGRCSILGSPTSPTLAEDIGTDSFPPGVRRPYARYATWLHHHQLQRQHPAVRRACA